MAGFNKLASCESRKGEISCAGHAVSEEGEEGEKEGRVERTTTA
jgi:hypothetical protein